MNRLTRALTRAYWEQRQANTQLAAELERANEVIVGVAQLVRCSAADGVVRRAIGLLLEEDR